MDIEENRLGSFDDWPPNPPVDGEELARNGFFATGAFMEAECNWCHKTIADWQFGEQVEERHRRADPTCPLLLNPNGCGNVAITANTQAIVAVPPTAVATTNPEVATSSQQVQQPLQLEYQPLDLHVEASRLATFKNWPNPNIAPQSLAKAGFYYLQRSDEVQCAWCKGIIAKWEKQDNAFEEHRRFFPDCPRVQLGPLIEIASDGIRDLGIQQITPPKKPKFSSLDARLRTYSNWPIPDTQRPEALAQAGLYYQNLDDQVRCFHCNIGLRSWQKIDDPWFEHAKWYPQCQFVRLVKGPSYIQHVQELARQTTAQPIPSMTIDAAMSTTPVRQALEIGIDGGSIRNATQQQILRTGRPFDNVEALVKAVFGERDDAETNGSDQEHSGGNSDVTGQVQGENERGQIVREVSRLLNGIFSTGDHDDRPSTSGMTILSPATVETLCQPPSPVATTDNATAAVTTAPIEETAATAVLPERAHSPPPGLSLEEENRKLKDARLCKVCLDEEVGVVFLPCGHLVTCVQCAQGVSQCPMCRTVIKGFVRTYLS